DRRPDDRRTTPVGDTPGAGAQHADVVPLLRRADGHLRRAGAGGRDPPSPRLSRRRRLGALDRGDGAARPAARRAAQGRNCVTKPPVPAWRWALWLAILAPALVVFYVLLTPVWVAIRLARR